MENNIEELLDITFKFEKFPISLNRLLKGESELYNEWLKYARPIIFDQYRRKYEKIYQKRVFCIIRMYIKDSMDKDIDNFSKISLDALKGTVLKEDGLIDILIIYKLRNKPYEFIELQVVDIEKPIKLSELIPKSDYIWIREKNQENEPNFLTKQAKTAIDYENKTEKEKKINIKNKIFEKIIDKNLFEVPLFKRFYDFLETKGTMKKEERSNYSTPKTKKILANCIFLRKKIIYDKQKEKEQYAMYYKFCNDNSIGGLVMSKADFLKWFESEYKKQFEKILNEEEKSWLEKSNLLQ